MMLAYDYPILGFFWSVLMFYLVIAWIMALFHVLGDIFRSPDMGGFAKAVWLIFVVVAPFLGVFCYLIARGDKMAAHAAERARAQESAFQSYVRETAGTSSPADQLTQLSALRDSGAITAEEYEAGKAKILV